MDTSTSLAPLAKLCTFELSPGVTCSAPIHCRTFCERHYSQLRRAGAFLDSARKPPAKRDQVLANVASVRRARKKLLKAMPDLIDAFVVGAKVAAIKGRTEPLQWAALHTRVLEPVATANNSAPQSGVTINVGVKVSGTSTMKDD